MKINFVISKLYNHFHFVENMSEWSEYTRKGANKDWTHETGPLTDEEAAALENVRKFLRTFDYGKAVGSYKNIFEFFAVAESMVDYKSELLGLIGGENAGVMLAAMEVFRTRFEKIWAVQKTNFDSKYPVILENLHEDEIKKDLTKIFGINEFPEEINTYLVINTSEYASGGANIGKDRITLECSSAVGPNDIMTIFWHEVAHLLQTEYATKVHQILKRDKIRYDFVSEMLAHSVFGTYGVLSHKYYHAPYMDRGMAKMKSYLVTGEVSEEDKGFVHLIPFMVSQYYTAQFIKQRITSSESVTPEEIAKEILEISNKTGEGRYED